MTDILLEQNAPTTTIYHHRQEILMFRILIDRFYSLKQWSFLLKVMMPRKAGMMRL